MNYDEKQQQLEEKPNYKGSYMKISFLKCKYFSSINCINQQKRAYVEKSAPK